ncbi:hypothetical protein BV22DRAFT_1035671 [Leucogyrophana mollusca]|uniref:Uncharacterized protein n=1 Tax=Leucogyrophana mollusca TaxID=85980 RepID=A0ACB8BEV8_9AGAM|nr:hypothetical protein BV22DRAFT_1035671 [Leucogyrophana mollusca]
MTTYSLEQRKTIYSRELAAYTLRQWTAVRRTIDAQNADENAITDAMRKVYLASAKTQSPTKSLASGRSTSSGPSGARVMRSGDLSPERGDTRKGSTESDNIPNH